MAEKQKVADLSTKLIDLAEERNFKIFLGKVEEGLAIIAGGNDDYFDKYETARVLLVNQELDFQTRRVAIAQALKNFEALSEEEKDAFYFEIKEEELAAEKVLGILIDREKFVNSMADHQRTMSYNDTIMTLSKEFCVKPSLVAKYAKVK